MTEGRTVDCPFLSRCFGFCNTFHEETGGIVSFCIFATLALEFVKIGEEAFDEELWSIQIPG